jgi:hypothetical protein
MAIRLSDLIKGKGALTPKQLKQVQRWIDDDWEVLDLDRELVALIMRLMATIRAAPR